MSARLKVATAVTLLAGAALLGWFSAYRQQYYLLLSFMLAVLSLIPFLFRFERKRVHARELVLIAVLSAIAAVSRVPFAVLPSIQPTSFIIIVSGWALGAEAGFIIGALAAFVSNLFLGQGLWTPWQMFSWGLMGLTAGLMRTWIRSRFGMTLFGFVWGFVFGWLMNLVGIVSGFGGVSWQDILLLYALSFYFDLMHACSNAFFLWFFGLSFLRILARFCKKYGIFSGQNS